MRNLCLFAALTIVAMPATASELEVAIGAQGVTTQWEGDHGGGLTLDGRWWVLPWLGVTYLGKEQFATVDERFLSYLSLNAAVRHTLGRVRLTETLGLVHQHEESYPAVMDQPVASAFGVADGIRHRMGARAGVSVAVPVLHHDRGDLYLALDLDATRFSERERGPAWMMSAGVSVGVTYDLAHQGVAR
jgi:hypothetical protein